MQLIPDDKTLKMTKNNLKTRLVKNKKDLKNVFNIRKIIFIKEQGVNREIERDKFDNIAKHVIVLLKNKPIGCARIRFVGKKAKLERIAILKKHRGKGFGKLIVNYLIEYCKNKNVKGIYMNSQYYLKGYYGRLGFKPKGKTFMEAGIKHIKMYLK